MYDADHTSQKISELEAEYRKSQQKKSVQSLTELEAQVRAELKFRATEDDNVYDQEFEDMISSRLDKLDDESRSEFYRLRTNRKNDGILSAKEIDLLTLEAMEKSYAYYIGTQGKTSKQTRDFHFTE